MSVVSWSSDAGVVHHHQLAGLHLPAAVLVVPLVAHRSRADDGRIRGRLHAVLDMPVGGLGLELVLVLAGRGGLDGALHRLGADAAAVAQDLDLARRLDQPQPVDVRRDVAELVVGELQPQRRRCAARPRLGASANGLIRRRAGLDGGVDAAAARRRRARTGASRTSRCPTRRAAAPRNSPQRGDRLDRREAVRLGRVGFVEPVAALVANLRRRELGQEQVRRLGGGVDHQHGVQRLVAGEIEEVVVLAEAQARRGFGGAEHHDACRAARRCASFSRRAANSAGG